MNNSQAEIKPPKFGELLTSNVEDNPEPSQVVLKGVETRRAVCIKCKQPLKNNHQKRFCSDKCRHCYNVTKSRVKHGKLSKPGIGSGNNQIGTNNHAYKDGIGCFRRIAFEYYEKKCNRCAKTEMLLVHHIDENRHNNKVSNLEILCKKCHQKHHTQRCNFTGKYIKG